MAPVTVMATLRPTALVLALIAGAAQAQEGAPPVIPQPPGLATEVPPCRPRSLVKMTVRNVTPGLQALDQRAQPRQMWRLGARYLRNIEPPIVSQSLTDPKAPMARQPLVIIAEPDIWTIDLASKTGQHGVDKGVPEVRAPILPPGAPPEFMSLEFGCEMEFVAVRAPVAQRTIRWGEIDAGIHIYTIGTASLALLMNDQIGQPIMITYVRDNRPMLVLRYDEYRQGLPDQPDLFRPSADIKITEAPKASPKSKN